MPYVSRRIACELSEGKSEELSDSAFADLNGPLVLIGEPGAGKTDTAKAIADMKGGVYVQAARFVLGAPLPAAAASGVFVIDGLDEVTQSSQAPPINIVLRRLHELGATQFVITCRAADWSNFQSQQHVEAWQVVRPYVGHLLPLSDDEIAAVVDSLDQYPAGGVDFVEQATQKQALELARNPQSIGLFLAAISIDGWPGSKTELYEVACTKFAHEHNRLHQSLAPNRPDTETIMQAAGQIFAQLLLAGSTGVAIDGQIDPLIPRPADLETSAAPSTSMIAAIASQLFRPCGQNAVEPCHRTVAEYLAARWITAEINAGRLSVRRLLALLYVNGVVPAALRGMHAWIATLCRAITDPFCANDPYGCLRYGDVGQFSIDQAKGLLRELQKLSDLDPYFRGSDWSAQVGAGLARIELKDQIVDLIKETTVPYHLTTIILEALRGSDLAGHILADLVAVASDENQPYGTRSRALEAIDENAGAMDWRQLGLDLAAAATEMSTRLSIQVVISNPAAFSGGEIASLILAYDVASQRARTSYSSNIDYNLFPKLTVDQLVAVLDPLASSLPADRFTRSAAERKTEERILACLKAVLSKGGTLSAEQIWSALSPIGSTQYHTSNWSDFSRTYFATNEDLRRKVQEIFLSQPEEHFNTRWNRLVDSSDVAPGLRVNEGDVVYHLQRLTAQGALSEADIAIWKDLVAWAIAHRNFDGSAVALARTQAAASPELAAALHALDNRPMRDWETKENERRAAAEAEQQKRDTARHQQYAPFKDRIAAGDHLGALNNIALAYIGMEGNVHHLEGPLERVKALVGDEVFAAALEGLIAALHRSDMPTPLELTELRVLKSQTFHLENIAVVGCALHAAMGGQLSDLPLPALKCGLVGAQWGLYSNPRHGLRAIQSELEHLVFSDADATATFISDTVGTTLLNSTGHVMGLYEVTHQDRFKNVIGDLTRQWLNHADQLSAEALRSVLSGAIDAVDSSELGDLIQARLDAGAFPDRGHRELWLGAAFAVDHARFAAQLVSFAKEQPANLWSLIQFASPDHGVSRPRPLLAAAQLTFLIQHFAGDFPIIDPPKDGSNGKAPYEAGQFINASIRNLGAHTDPSASGLLQQLIAASLADAHLDFAKHMLAERIRNIADSGWKPHNLKAAREVLFSGPPSTVEDLQALVMDQLAGLAERLQNGVYNGVLPYWQGDEPHNENYCRDRIAEGLEPYLKPFGVRVHTEGTMPDGNRCDLLCTIGELDLPIEIKGQWHPKVWEAACDQLEDNYTRQYRSDGRGIYLVIWFGDVPRHNPPDIRVRGKPKNAADMLAAIHKNLPRELNPRTRTFILDVERPTPKP